MRSEFGRAHNVLSRLQRVLALLLLLAAAGSAWAQVASPVFRFYNRLTGTHFYTISTADRDIVLASFPSMAFEGAVFFAYPTPVTGMLPVYRFYNRVTGTHFYTQSESDKNIVLTNFPAYAFEGIAYYAPQTMSTGRAPLFRFFNQRTGSHFFTTSTAERDVVLANWPWFSFEGVAYHVFTSGSDGGNALPIAKLTVSPGSTMTVPMAVQLDVDASDTDGTISKVEFYLGLGKIGETTAPPYSMLYTVSGMGDYPFRAVAYDNTGASSPSNTITFKASTTPVANLAPKVSLATSTTQVTVPGSVILTATASDDDGTIASVAFYQGGALLATVTTAPYTYTYNAAAQGQLVFSAVAKDNLGAQTSSNSVNVGAGLPASTNLAPKISLVTSATQIPVPGSVVLTATASDDDGTVANVRFYQNGSLLATVTTPPYTYTHNIVGAAIYSYTARATDNLGAITTTPVILVGAGMPVSTNALPRITLGVTPSTLVTAPTTMTLTATVSDTDGTVTRVQFYRNGAKIGEKLAAPWTFTSDMTTAGSTATFSADVTDNGGATVATLPVKVVAQTPMTLGVASADVWRFLNQATFGASHPEAARVAQLGGIPAWINDQFTKPISGYPATRFNKVQLAETVDCTTRDPAGVSYPTTSPQSQCVRDHLTLAMLQRDLWTNALTAPDQLRQRVAWALSQILVISANEPDLSKAYVMARYQQILFEEAFGNFGNLLKRVTYSPAMGNWLDAVNNDRPSGTRVPNENYAREILQLFGIGLEELKLDGTPMLDALGNAIQTYDQDDIKQYARVFTGMTYAKPDGSPATTKNGVYYNADMIPYPSTATTGHDPDIKQLLAYPGTTGTLPALQTAQQDFDAAVSNVFNHPNTAPFISKQLIQRLVTGNPSPAYVQRVASKFVNNGSGVRGDMKAVVMAILTDPDARGNVIADQTFGTLREPVLMVSGMLRALGNISDGGVLSDRTAVLGQRPYYAPTVFNYFQPDTTIPGTNILAPEFTIHNSNYAVARTNLVYSLVYQGIAPDGTLPNSTGTRLNLLQFEPLADNPVTLVDTINNALLGGQLPVAARDQIVTAVTAIPTSTTSTQYKTDRTRMAAYLMASSFHYQVQR